jgi:hypothetical protein
VVISTIAVGITNRIATPPRSRSTSSISFQTTARSFLI